MMRSARAAAWLWAACAAGIGAGATAGPEERIHALLSSHLQEIDEKAAADAGVRRALADSPVVGAALAEWAAEGGQTYAYVPPNEPGGHFAAPSAGIGVSVGAAMRDLARERYRTVLYHLLHHFYGIEFHYVVGTDAAGERVEGNALDCPVLGEVMGALLNYPGTLLSYIGHASPGFSVYIYAPCADASCPSNGEGYARASAIHISSTGAFVVHETAHAIDSMCIRDGTRQEDPRNPLAGCAAEYDEAFAIPGEWEWITTANWRDVFGWNRKPIPPGFCSGYELCNRFENFATVCEGYVCFPDELVRKARLDALGSPTNIGLARKYAFAERYVFGEKRFTEMRAPEAAVVRLSPDDKGDGDGRVEPGEEFTIDLTLVPLRDMAAGSVSCRPASGETGVAPLLWSRMFPALQKGRRYQFSGAFRYRLRPDARGEWCQEFRIVFPGGASEYDHVSLNEDGHAVGWDTDPHALFRDDPQAAWDRGEEVFYRDPAAPELALVRLSSSTGRQETTPVPAAAIALLPVEDHRVRGTTRYDEGRDCFWVVPDDPASPICRMPRLNPAGIEACPVNPAGQAALDYDAGEHRYNGGRPFPRPYTARVNPFDGALWLAADGSPLAARYARGPRGGLRRSVVDLRTLDSAAWEEIRDIDFDTEDGAVWLVSQSRAARLSPDGRSVLWSGAGFEDLRRVAACPGGGCWLVSCRLDTCPSETVLRRIASDGSVDGTRRFPFPVTEATVHPYDRALWLLEAVSGPYSPPPPLPNRAVYSHRLRRIAASGEQVVIGDGGGTMSTIIPSSLDGSVFVNLPTKHRGVRIGPDGEEVFGHVPGGRDCLLTGFHTFE